MKRAIVVALILGLATCAFAVEIEPTGTFYFWYWYNMSDYPDWYALHPYAGDSAFYIERVYAGFNFATDWKLSGQFLFDVGQDLDKDYALTTTTDEDGNVTGATLTSTVLKAPYHAYLKHAYLQYPIFSEYLNIRGGSIPSTFPNEVTKAWGYRVVADGPVSGFAKWESTADLGLDLFGGYKKWVLYHFTFTNGEGYTKPEANAGKALSLMLQTYPANMVKVLENLNLALYARSNSVNPDYQDNTALLAALIGWKYDFDFGLGLNLGFTGGLQRHNQARGYAPDYKALGKALKDEYDTSYNYDDSVDGLLMSGFGEISYSLKGVNVDYGKVALFGRYDVFDPNTRNDTGTYDKYVRDYKNEADFDPTLARAITGAQDEKAYLIMGVSYAYKKFRVCVDYQTTSYSEAVDSDDVDADLDTQRPADTYIFTNFEFSF